MVQETSIGMALKVAMKTLSKKRQTDLISEHIYKKYDVFNRFKPLSIGIDKDLINALPQYDPQLIMRVLSNHCRRPRYIKALSFGGKRFDLSLKAKGEISLEEQKIAQQHPCMQSQRNPKQNNPQKEVKNQPIE